MPVKNNKSPKKHKIKKKTSKEKPDKRQAEIEKVAREISTLLNEGEHKEINGELTVPPPPRRPLRKSTPIYEQPHKSRLWLWVGAVAISSLILIMWALNISTLFYESKTSSDPAKEIFSRTKNDLRAVIDTFSDQEKNISNQLTTTTKKLEDQVKQEQIKQILANSLLPLFSSSTPSTTSSQSDISPSL